MRRRPGFARARDDQVVNVGVYVDDGKEPYRGMLMSHLCADSTEELLAMADRIGIPRKWIQCSGTYREHFDVCQSKRTPGGELRRGAGDQARAGAPQPSEARCTVAYTFDVRERES